MPQGKRYRHDAESIFADEIEEWFTARDWLAAGEKFRSCSAVALQRLMRPEPDRDRATAKSVAVA
jgi:hypothetical protein